jgi:triacylglycerol lipase
LKKLPFILFSCLVLLNCATAPRPLDVDASQRAIPLKYPVVFVHGIVAHDRKSLIDFWGEIPERLNKEGIIIYYGNTDAWGSIESNAELLKNTIDKILQEKECEKVNIIAHSKGGIDSRYLIYAYNYADKVASLTTVSTPHKGAEMADMIYNHKMVKNSKAFKRFIKDYEKKYGDINPDMFGVNYQLTTENMAEFNERTGMVDERVYFQSLYTTMEKPADDLLFGSSFKYIKSVAGANDGVVSEYSACWGNNYKKIEGRISHRQITDRKKIRGIDILEIYVDIAKDLYERGL